MATSCGMMNTVTKGSQYAKMYEEKPVTLLVMPPINNSTHVEARDLLYTSMIGRGWILCHLSPSGNGCSEG